VEAIDERPRAAFHEGRLRAALAQLATGVAALHAMGKLHRDLNSGNVLVTPEGRVVVIDFGLVIGRARPLRAAFDGISGTPGYMSPEQAAGKIETPASDWYAFGVMLFEALTAELPFHGNTSRVLANKQRLEAPRPSSRVSGVPADLDELCAALLRRSPDDRPEAPEILRRLGVKRTPASRWATAAFVGRREELAALEQARSAAGRGAPVIALVDGAPGSGVTSLCERFLADVAAADGAVVLRGAVSAREPIPHRALDALVDALALHLAALGPAQAEALLPPEARALARVFPVLDGVVAAAPEAAGGDEHTAFAALAEVVRRLAASAPLVLWIDDVTQADPDELVRLVALVPAPRSGARAPLLLLSGTADASAAEPIVATVAALPATMRRIRVDPLPPGDARTLARHALRRAGGPEARAAEVARAAEGSPLLVEELAFRLADPGAAAEPASVAALIEAKLGALPDAALRLVEVLAAARAPIPQGAALAVAGIASAAGALEIVARLGAARLAKVRGAHVTDAIAVFDERVRGVVTARLPPAVLRRIHGDLAEALARLSPPDHALVAEHFDLAGDREGAVEQIRLAAEAAFARREPDRAAALYARALDWMPPAHAETRVVAARRAEALACGSRAVEAARAFLGAAAGAPPAEAQALRRRAAEHLFVSGRIEDALALLRPVLAAHGLRYPETPRTALLLLIARLVHLRVRGTRFAPAAYVPPAERARIEVAWTAGKGLLSVDPIRSAVFMVDALLRALAAGDPALVAKSLAFVGCIFVYDGDPAQEQRGSELIDEAARLAQRVGDPYLIGLIRCFSALARMCTGRWREALVRMDDSLEALEASGAPIAWERNAYHVIGCRTLFAMGALRERTRRAERWLADARAHGDGFAETEATLALVFARVAADEPARALAEVRQAGARLPSSAFTLQHQIALSLTASIHLYEGVPGRAWAALEEARPALDASQLLRIQRQRIEALALRGVTAAALAAHRRGAAGGLLDEADDAADQLVRERRPHASAAATVVRAGVAWARGELGRAVELLGDAARAYDAVEMKVHAACARRVAGVADLDLELVACADEELRAEGIVDPARWARMYTGIEP
jgi:tetratricopeptide (TPR) repeat protein